MNKTQTLVAAGVLLATMPVLAAPAFAQTGNLVPNGRFDLADGVNGWQVISPQFSSLVFDPALDADSCADSGSAWATSDPSVDFGTAQYRVCLGPVAAGESYWIGGEVLFLSSAVAGRSNLTLSFSTGPNCSGPFDGGLFAGYAVSTVAGWQPIASGPAVPGPTIQSVMMSVLLTQQIGAEPAIVARFDEIRVTLTDWIFAEDFEIDDTCRWDAALP